MGSKLYLESYGCQMNFSDSEIVASILADAGLLRPPRTRAEADLILLNTCSIRDNAEQQHPPPLAAPASVGKQRQAQAEGGHPRLHG